MISSVNVSFVIKFYFVVSILLLCCDFHNDYAEASIIDRLNKIVNTTMDIRNSIRAAVSETVGEQFQRNIEKKGDTELVGRHDINNKILEKSTVGSIFDMIETVS